MVENYFEGNDCEVLEKLVVGYSVKVQIEILLRDVNLFMRMFCLSVRPSVRLSVRPSVSPSVCPSHYF